MTTGLDHLNDSRKRFRFAQLNDLTAPKCYRLRMAAPVHDWYLREWLKTLHKKQTDIVKDLDWNKARVSLMIRGEQQYTRDAVNELAHYLNIRPYELLMHPDDAMRLRRLRADMLQLATDIPDGASNEASVTALRKVS